MRILSRIAASLLLLLTASPLAAQQQLAIKGARIIPIVGDTLDEGVILIRDGKITAVGKDLAIPIDAKVIDASGKTVIPGFVEAHSPSGLSQANEQNPNVPFLSVVDSIDPSLVYFERRSRRNGVTTVAVTPGNSTMIGGQTAIIKTAGSYVDDMILKRNAGIKISMRPSSGSRMSHYAKLRLELEKAKTAMADEAKKKEEEEAKKKDSDQKDNDKKDSEKKDEKATPSAARQSAAQDAAMQLKAMKKLLSGELQAVIYCENGIDVVQALKLSEQFKLKPLFVLGRECYRAVDLLAKSKRPVVLDPALVYWRTDPRTGKDEKIVVPRIFHEKNVPVVFQIGSSTSFELGSSYLWYQAAIAVKYGMSVDEALKSLTLGPAQALGVDEFVGSIEPGKDADLVILSGEPLKVNTWVDQTLVNGKVVYERSKDEKLKDLLNNK